jgi:hypothetical protein
MSIYIRLYEVSVAAALRAVRGSERRTGAALTRANKGAVYHRKLAQEKEQSRKKGEGLDNDPGAGASERRAGREKAAKERSDRAETGADAASKHHQKKAAQAARIKAKLKARAESGHLQDPRDKKRYGSDSVKIEKHWAQARKKGRQQADTDEPAPKHYQN